MEEIILIVCVVCLVIEFWIFKKVMRIEDIMDIILYMSDGNEIEDDKK